MCDGVTFWMKVVGVRRSGCPVSLGLDRRRRLGSVTGWIASLPVVGLGAQTLAIPDHRLDHGVWGPQQLSHVVLLDQTIQDALMVPTERKSQGNTGTSKGNKGTVHPNHVKIKVTVVFPEQMFLRF